MEELTIIANHIKKCGRISISDICSFTNELLQKNMDAAVAARQKQKELENIEGEEKE
jgi:hypothetical protein